jgi:hypothetical protein
MSSVPIWPGSSSFATGSTPFGFYDTEVQFQSDADKVANFCARRLGFPIVDIELQDINFYAAFEEAVTTYGNELYSYKVRDNLLSLEGASTGSSINNALITPNLDSIIRMSKQYGAEAGSGGNITWFDGLIALTSSIQDYNLTQWAIDSGITGSIEIKRIFYTGAPAVTRFYDPFAGSGTGTVNLLDSFGFGGYSPAVNFVLMPINYDLQIMQQIEFNDSIRRSQFTFELVNNYLKIFPIPDGRVSNLKIQYIKTQDRLDNSIIPTSGITNVSNVPYNNPSYTQINSVGRQWIFEYTLSIVKEILGYVRGKYGTIPIPGSETTLNSGDLISAATNEKEKLIERLRAYFDDTSRKALLERRSMETEFRQKEITIVPMQIFIG